MENWNNLNKLLSLNAESTKLKEEESQKLVELCQKGEKDEVKKLLKTGASINCFADNSTPLISCIENDFEDLAQYLLKVGAHIAYKPNESTDDALWYSLKNKKYNFLNLFIQHRCLLSVDAQTRQTNLIYATVESDLRAVTALLNHPRIKVGERDALGNTALHHNVLKAEPTADDLEIGRLLIAAGADINAQNMAGKTPQEEAVDYTAKTMLLASKLDNELTHKMEDTPEGEPAVIKPPTKKVKI